MKNIIISAGAIGVLLGVAAFFGYSPFLKIVQNFGTTSGNAASQKIAQWSFNPSSTSATTSSSLINSDGQDRIVSGVDVTCSGVTTADTSVANWTFLVATTSASAPAGFANSNYVFGVNISTTTSEVFTSTTTITKADTRRWASGTYLTVSANATDTAACIVAARYYQGLGI